MEEKLEKINHPKKWNIGKTSQWLVEHAKEAGIDIDGFEHEITDYFKNHVLKEHGNSNKEKAKGQIAINENDFDKISDVVECPDYVMIGAKRDGKDVLNSNKSLRGKTMFKRIKDINIRKVLNIVSMNKATDISKAKIVSPVGTGSNPSYNRSEESKVVANPIQPSG